MKRLKAKVDFHDWEAGFIRKAGTEFEMTDERYEEFVKHLEDQDIDVKDVVEEIKKSKKAAGGTPAK
ncbi:hypothetical protein [Streptococcus sp. 20-1249]|uniref:hypothetical protein n=1 Tax=Streptococcus hepaticus TaxID=3349163 RepID=UPI00374A3B40